MRERAERKAVKVGSRVVHELYGAMQAEGVVAGFVVTSGSFTQEAIAFSTHLNGNVTLVDAPMLFQWIQQSHADNADRDLTERQPTLYWRRSSWPEAAEPDPSPRLMRRNGHRTSKQKRPRGRCSHPHSRPNCPHA
jgi:restriction system protein